VLRQSEGVPLNKSTIVSVVVPVFQEERTIRGLLVSLNAQSFSGFEVVCVDNGSRDASMRIISEVACEVDYPLYLLTEPMPGPGYARQKGAEFVTQRAYSRDGLETNHLIVTTDADCLPPPSWLDDIYSSFEMEDWGIAGGAHQGPKEMDDLIEAATKIPLFFQTVADINRQLSMMRSEEHV
jgi:glycosyltransferase involved in cell wall biosynthesis